MWKNKKLKLLSLLSFLIFIFFPLKIEASVVGIINSIREDFLDKSAQLEAAGAAMSLPTIIYDYYSIVGIEKVWEIKIEPLFDDWADITIVTDGKRKDPVTFYFPKEGNEEAIYYIQVIRYGSDAGPPTIDDPTTPTPPPPQPGKLAFPVTVVKYNSHFYACRNGCSRAHMAIDLGGPPYTPVYAAADGEIVAAQWGTGYQGIVIIKHPQLNLTTHYAHLNVNFPSYIKVGNEIKQGQLVGTMYPLVDPETKKSKAHVDFGVQSGLAADYGQYINRQGKGWKGEGWQLDPVGYLPPMPHCPPRWNYYPNRSKTPPPECKSCVPPAQQC